MNRRQFIAAAPLTLAAAPYVLGRSGKTYRTALIGAGWWGMNILREALAAGRSSVVALCDADGRTLTTAAAQVNDISARCPRRTKIFANCSTRKSRKSSLSPRRTIGTLCRLWPR